MRGRLLITVLSTALAVLGSVPAVAQTIPPEIPDPAGDTIDFVGNPAEGPDLLGVTAVEVTEYEGFDAQELFDLIFDFGPAPGFVGIIPDEPGPLLRGSGPLILVQARLSRPLPDARHCQIVIAFRTDGLEQYPGAVGDPNNQNDTTLDAFLQSGEWMTGRTEYRAGSFSFVSDYNEVAAAIGEEAIVVVFPREAIPGGASWQIWVICGDDAVSAGRDFADLGSFLPGIIPTVSMVPPATTSTTTTSTSTTTTVAGAEATQTTSTTMAVGVTETTAGASSTDGGGNTLGILIVALLTVGGLAGYFLFRKREGPCDCDEEKAVYDASQARFAKAESDLSAARQVADDWRGRRSEAQSAIAGLDAVRPRRGEFSEPSEFATADADYSRRRAELESSLAECGAELAEAEARVSELEPQAQERWDESQAMLAILSACWQRCFNTPYDAGSTSTRPSSSGGGEGSGDDDGDDPRDTPPPVDPECEGDETREEVERTGTFRVLVDGRVRVFLSTDRGPLENLEDLVGENPVADLFAELFGPDGALELDPGSLTPANAARWESGVRRIRTISMSVAKSEVYVNLAFDVEDVTVDCIRMDECQGGRWVTVGRRTEETSRTADTVLHQWSESTSKGRPLGVTTNEVQRLMGVAEAARRAWQDFLAGCR